MIDARELRIGNWGQSTESNHTFQYQCTVIQNTLNILCEPIPITPEVLEKCGFVMESYVSQDGPFNEWKLNIKGVISFYLEQYKGGINLHTCEFYFRHEDYSPIKHLHQLQNLYFALTGTELNYTP